MDVVVYIIGGWVLIFEILGFGLVFQKFEVICKFDYEDWVVSLGFDVVVWFCNGDVGKVDVDVNEELVKDVWCNGVLYLNGNCVICQLGIFIVSVFMGVMVDMKMLVNLIFVFVVYDDSNFFCYVYVFEVVSYLC